VVLLGVWIVTHEIAHGGLEKKGETDAKNTTLTLNQGFPFLLQDSHNGRIDRPIDPLQDPSATMTTKNIWVAAGDGDLDRVKVPLVPTLLIVMFYFSTGVNRTKMQVLHIIFAQQLESNTRSA